MDTLKSLVSKINSALNGKTYYYVSNEIEHGLGLSDQLDNFVHVCLKDSYWVDYLAKNGKKVICKWKQNETIRSSAELLDGLDIGNSYFQTFKISPQFEAKVLQNGGFLMNTPTRLNYLFERKISQINLFGSVGISVPKFMTGKLILMNYREMVKELGEEIVIQFDRGHTGSGTHFVRNFEEFKELVKVFPQREARFSTKVEGKTYTCNLCVTSNGVFAGGMSEQLTGIEGLTAEQGGTVGNNFNHDLNTRSIELLINEIKKLGFLLMRNGYRGLFGIDFIFDHDSNELFIIEMNARQTMSLAFHSALSRIFDQVPLNLIHVAEYLGIKVELNSEEYSRNNLLPIDALQVYKRNTLGEPVCTSSELKTGEYYVTDSGLKFIKEVITYEEVGKGNILYINQKPNVAVEHGGELSRIQSIGGNKEQLINILLNN